MKHSFFSKIQTQIKIMSVSLAEGKALVRGIFAGACFSKKEIIR